MKKLLTAFLILLLMLTGCTATSNDSTSDTSLQDILDKGTLVIGYTDYPPFAILDGENVTGFDIDLAQEVAKRLEVTLEMKYIDWDAKDFELNNGNIDAIWNGFTITEERQKQVTFTEPYLENNIAILTLTDSTVESLSDLASLKVGVELQSSGQTALENNTEVYDSLEELVKYTTVSEALMALKTGAIDAVVADENYARYVIGKDQESYKIAEETFNPEYYGIGLRLGSEALAEKINDTIAAMIEDGTATTISMKWFNEDLIIKP